MAASPKLEGNVSRIDTASESSTIYNGLDKLLSIVAGACPDDAIVRFQYDGTLRVTVDVRSVEQAQAVETLLPTLAGGIFRDPSRTQTPNHSFLRRVTARVER